MHVYTHVPRHTPINIILRKLILSDEKIRNFISKKVPNIRPDKHTIKNRKLQTYFLHKINVKKYQ